MTRGPQPCLMIGWVDRRAAPAPAPPHRRSARSAAWLLLAAEISTAMCCCNVPLSDAAEITDFAVEYMIGAAQIDAVARTGTATVEPADVAALHPDIGVSPRASPGTVTLADGQSVPVTVTAENGRLVVWQVAVTAAHGITVEYESRRAVLMRGFADSTDTENHAFNGSGLPAASRHREAGVTLLAAMSEPLDYLEGSGVPPSSPSVELTAFLLAGVSAGTYSGADALRFGYTQAAGHWNLDEIVFFSATDGSLTVTVSRYGEVGDVVVGSYSGALRKFVGETQVGVVDVSGFIKVARNADDTLPPVL